jgi:hypothetical protein
VEVYLHTFPTSAPDGGEWSASCPGRFIPSERAVGTHWVGPNAGLDAAGKKRNPIIDPAVRYFKNPDVLKANAAITL